MGDPLMAGLGYPSATSNGVTKEQSSEFSISFYVSFLYFALKQFGISATDNTPKF
jgi:hypothetical protein